MALISLRSGTVSICDGYTFDLVHEEVVEDFNAYTHPHEDGRVVVQLDKPNLDVGLYKGLIAPLFIRFQSDVVPDFIDFDVRRTSYTFDLCNFEVTDYLDEVERKAVDLMRRIVKEERDDRRSSQHLV